ncbi:Pentatricopeptide repeat-containing protein, partial [Mucuna pruriens]
MEKNLIILPSKSWPPLFVPSYSGTQFEWHGSTRVLANSNNVSMTKTSHPKLMDTQLNQLCVNGPLSEAVEILDSLAQQGSKVRPITFMNLLQACIDRDCIWVGRELHARIGFVGKVNPFVETKLVSMYAKCGHLDEARKVFDEMRERNLFTWSAMIGACSRELKWEEVVDLFYDMMQHGGFPDELLLPKILKACGKCRDFETGRLIHSMAIRGGMCSLLVINSILAMYAKCGEITCAEKLFRRMDERNCVSWNVIITGYCQKGEIEQAQKYFDAIQEEGIEPGLVTWNILIASYNQLGHCDIAMNLMRKMESFGIAPDVYTWTSMISGFTQKGRINDALDLLREMFIVGVDPNSITIASAASACASVKSLSMGSEIHSIAVKTSLVDDILIGNSLIDMYAKGGNLEAAQRIFDVMLERDVYSWNSIIGGYCQAGLCGKAHELFMKMQESDSPPNVVTWNVMITGFMQNGAEDEALDLFQRIEKDGKIKPNVASWNSLISGFLQSRQKDKALQMFRRMQFCNMAPNLVTVLTILPACANLVAAKKVKEIHCCAVRRNIVSELSVSNTFIDCYAKAGNIMYSRKIFDGLSPKDIISWNSLLSGYVLHGCSESAIDLFDQMRKDGLHANRVTLASIILAYGHAGMVDEGKHAFSSISKEYQIRLDLEHYSSMVYLLSRSGKLAEALEFIQNMPVEPSSSVWAALLTACRIHRNFGMAIFAGECLLELEPENIITQHILSQAYSVCGKSWKAPKITKLEKEKVVKKPVGQSWIEMNNMVHTFVVGDQSNPYLDRLHSWLKRVGVNVKAHISDNGLYIEEEEKENVSSVHSEKLAFAFALIDSHHAPQIIRIIVMTQPNTYRWHMVIRIAYTILKMSFEDSKKKPESVGPWGGNGGSRWDDGIYSGVRQLVIVHGEGIDSIQIEYDKKGTSIWSEKHGGSGCHKTDKVKLDCPNEFLTKIHGYYGSLNQWGPNLVRSLSFESNKKTYGPFGVQQGTYFSVPISGAKIVGFHGRCGWYIDAIGVYLKYLKQPNPSKTLAHSQSPIGIINTAENFGFSVIQGSLNQNYDIVLAVRQKDDFNKPLPTDNVSGKISVVKESNNIEHKEKMAQVEKSTPKVGSVVTYGPWGGIGGYVFDDGTYTGIRQINLSRNVGIVWIRVLYDYDGEAIWGSKQGGTGGFKNDKIVFDFPYEALTYISGYYGPWMHMGPAVIRSLTFHTTKRKYGPYGDEQGTYFTTKVKEGKIVGIHGRKGLFLDAFGVHVVEGKVIVPVATPPKEIIPRETSIGEIGSGQWPNKLVLAKPSAAEEVHCGVVKEPAPCGPGPWGGDGGRPWDDGVFSGIKQIFLTKVPEGICSIQIEYDRNRQSVWSVKHGGNGGDTMHRV